MFLFIIINIVLENDDYNATADMNGDGSVNIQDIVELISGPFKGEKARVVRVDLKKEELTIELFEATVPIPVTIRGDSIKVIRKEEKDEGED